MREGSKQQLIGSSRCTHVNTLTGSATLRLVLGQDLLHSLDFPVVPA
jgi:hypothetical protein